MKTIDFIAVIIFADGWQKPDEKGGKLYGKHLCKI